MTTLRAVAPSAPSSVSSTFDALVLVVPAPVAPYLDALGPVSGAARSAIENALVIDAALSKGGRPPAVLGVAGAPGGRVVLAAYGSGQALTADVEDVRLVAEATSAAVSRAIEAGASRPLVLAIPPVGSHAERFEHTTEIAALAALASQWVPLEAREAQRAPRTAETIGVVGLDEERARYVEAIELGRSLARDVASTEPERMAPLKAARLCEEAFAGTSVRVEVTRDVSRWPLLAAVARASSVVERHRPCVVRLDWDPGDAKRTVVVVGKGVTYDTGGADLKTDGAMAGMSRDKGGAAAVAGLLRTIAALKLPGVRVIGLLGLVRNSIGEEAFVSDEIIRSRAGVRVKIGNTDAEGRLVLADLLAEGRELLEGAPDPTLISIATLTGHVYRAHGPYVGLLANAPARKHVDALDRLAEAWGEPLERSRPRREDYALIAPRSPAEDCVSSNRLASVNTPRGHQFPFAFLDVAAGLRGGSLPFLHLDIGGAAVDPPDWQFGKPTGTPITTLTAWLSR